MLLNYAYILCMCLWNTWCNRWHQWGSQVIIIHVLSALQLFLLFIFIFYFCCCCCLLFAARHLTALGLFSLPLSCSGWRKVFGTFFGAFSYRAQRYSETGKRHRDSIYIFIASFVYFNIICFVSYAGCSFGGTHTSVSASILSCTFQSHCLVSISFRVVIFDKTNNAHSFHKMNCIFNMAFLAGW